MASVSFFMYFPLMHLFEKKGGPQEALPSHLGPSNFAWCLSKLWRMGNLTELIANPTFDFFAPPYCASPNLEPMMHCTSLNLEPMMSWAYPNLEPMMRKCVPSSTSFCTSKAFFRVFQKSDNFFNPITVLRRSKCFIYQKFLLVDRVPLIADLTLLS